MKKAAGGCRSCYDLKTMNSVAPSAANAQTVHFTLVLLDHQKLPTVALKYLHALDIFLIAEIHPLAEKRLLDSYHHDLKHDAVRNFFKCWKSDNGRYKKNKKSFILEFRSKKLSSLLGFWEETLEWQEEVFQ